MSSRANFPKTHTITTPRLLIRAATPSDAPALAALLGSPHNNPHTPVSPESALAETYLPRIERWRTAAAEGNSAFMVICLLRDDNENDTTLIGFGGFNGFRWSDDGRSVLKEADVGLLLDAAYWRRGLGSEALKAHIGYAFGVLGAERVTMGTGEGNEAFRGLVSALGLAGTERKWRVGDDDHGEEGDWQFDVERRDWEGVRGVWEV